MNSEELQKLLKELEALKVQNVLAESKVKAAESKAESECLARQEAESKAKSERLARDGLAWATLSDLKTESRNLRLQDEAIAKAKDLALRVIISFYSTVLMMWSAKHYVFQLVSTEPICPISFPVTFLAPLRALSR